MREDQKNKMVGAIAVAVVFGVFMGIGLGNYSLGMASFLFGLKYFSE